MNWKRVSTAGLVGALALMLIGGWWLLMERNTPVVENLPSPKEDEQTVAKEETSVIKEQGAAIGDENLVTFTCDGGKTITAVFERDIVGIALSDGRQVVLRETVQAQRYLSSDTSIEFVADESGVGTLRENDKMMYTSCRTSL